MARRVAGHLVERHSGTGLMGMAARGTFIDQDC